jgi:hypothetical protein
MKLGDEHPLVKISEKYEKVFAKAASHHITVTNAMARVLKADYGVTARPPSLHLPTNRTSKAQEVSCTTTRNGRICLRSFFNVQDTLETHRQRHFLDR